MTRPRFAAWRFGHPDLGAPEGVGIGVSPAGGVKMVSEEASIRQAITMLLSTMPGERVMRPHYGCPLHRLAFSPNDATTAGLAIHYVRQALERWEPRIDIVELDAGPVPDRPERLAIHLGYRVRATQRAGELEVGVDLAQGEA